MEKNRIAQHRQQFHDQLDELDAELQDLEAALQAAASPSDAPVSAGDSTKAVSRLQQQLLRLNYSIAELCGQFQDYELATVYYHKVLAWFESREHTKREPPKPALTRTKSTAEPPQSSINSDNNAAADVGSTLSPHDLLLKENVLNNLAIMYFGAGDAAQAMGCLLDAKKLVRDRTERAPSYKNDQDTGCDALESGGSVVAAAQQQQHLEKTLTANYALFLHAKGNIEDAIHAASSVIEVTSLDSDQQESGDVEVARAKITALSLLSSCWKAKGDDEQAMEFAIQATQLADEIQDQTLLSRTHNNVALYYFEKSELAVALNHLMTAYRAAQKTSDFQQQAVIKYHIGLVIAELEASVELPPTSRARESSPKAPSHRGSSDFSLPLSETEGSSAAVEGKAARRSPSSRKSIVAATMTSAKDCFTQSENLATALPEQDHALTFLAHGCRGESEYYAGEFHTAEAEFSIALQRLQAILYPEPSALPSRSSELGSTELVKIQGHLLSYMGCTQLVEGKFELAEESHQCDLEMALKHEDIHAQQRGMRNLALVYNATQRYHDAIPLWREALEIASVLQSKADQMMAYSGLGIAMKELRITDQKGEFSELLALKENNPLQIFVRQRALAIELGDKNQQILAQRHIVSVYESPARPDIEQRLAECDTLVRLCEQYENLQYRADGYRSLANALTAQLARLSARGARFAEAVSVLTQKRDSICTKYQQATKTLKAATAVMLKAEESKASAVALKTPHAEDRHARPPISRVDVLQRK